MSGSQTPSRGLVHHTSQSSPASRLGKMLFFTISWLDQAPRLSVRIAGCNHQRSRTEMSLPTVQLWSRASQEARSVKQDTEK
jgi:hypothetical protein